jgi:predicted transcriptional regulator
MSEQHINERRDLTEQEYADVQELAAYMTQVQIADYLGITDRCFRKIMERDPKARSAYKKGRALAHKKVANSLIAQANDGNTAAAIFYLKTQQGWKEETQATIDLPQLKIVSPNATE